MEKHIALAFALSGLAVSAFAGADTYTIDPAFSLAHFDIERVGFSSQRGSFNKTSGQFTLDLAARTGSVEFTINTRSIDMGSAAWTSHLSDEGLFNVKKFPTMQFKSDKLVFDGEKVIAAEGRFTMLGVTRPLTVTVSNFQCGPSPVDKRAMCSGNVSGKLNRSDFGLTKYIPAVSDAVTISVPVDAYKN
jgi:polyisoprenoid-binding protein YceI